MDEEPPRKRKRIDNDQVDVGQLRSKRNAFLDSLSKPVSPPGAKGVMPAEPIKARNASNDQQSFLLDSFEVDCKLDASNKENVPHRHAPGSSTQILSSPIQLSKIRDLQASENMDTTSLHDILGDPLIKEAWIFNFCFDVDWLMQHFDPDVRDTVAITIIHGSWRKEDPRRIAINDACGRRPNVTAMQAYLPDAFGTHHSKMIVLIRHDELAQVVIHTANILAQDWTNMTQAVWRSPLLPFSKNGHRPSEDCIGTLFKNDLIRYLKAYGNKLKPLLHQLQAYDFSDVRASLVASVPSKFKISAPDDEVWGHEMLRRKLQEMKLISSRRNSSQHVVFQVSSIASITSDWLEKTLYTACETSRQNTSIIFPTATDVANSLDGYKAGGSIHTKAQTPAHLKQISMFRPQLCRWTLGMLQSSQSGRDLAAPHIKTYVCFAAKPTTQIPTPDIEWALVTSANLSMQAWGTVPKLAKGVKDLQEAIVHIQSYEIGVLVWPDMFCKNGSDVSAADDLDTFRMVPTFKKDKPGNEAVSRGSVIGLRMPYDLPLTSYDVDELPWSPQNQYLTPDRRGGIWMG